MLGTRREAQNLPTVSPSSPRMAGRMGSGSARDCHVRGVPGPAGSWPRAPTRQPPWPWRCLFPGRGRERFPGGGPWKERAHTHSLSSCPRLFVRNRAPFSVSSEPACVAHSPRSGKGGKVHSKMHTRSWRSQPPSPFATSFPTSPGGQSKHRAPERDLAASGGVTGRRHSVTRTHTHAQHTASQGPSGGWA